MFQGTYTTEFYRQLHRVLHQESGSEKPHTPCVPACAVHSGSLMPPLPDAAYRSLTLPFERRRLDWLAAVPIRALASSPRP